MDTGDLEAINEIYNQAVESGFSTAHTSPISMDERREWCLEHDPGRNPVFVWEEKGVLAGWISLGPYRKGREALGSVAEVSYYVHNDYHRRGIGSRLLEYVIDVAPRYNYKTLIAILLDKNISSIALLRKYGFELWGDMPGIAEINGGKFNHQYYGLRLNP